MVEKVKDFDFDSLDKEIKSISLSYRELSLQIGYSYTYLSQCRRKGEMPVRINLLICSYLGVPSDYFVSKPTDVAQAEAKTNEERLLSIVREQGVLLADALEALRETKDLLAEIKDTMQRVWEG